MKRNRFIYDFDTDNAYIETDDGKLTVGSFIIKFSMKCGETEIKYWPSSKKKRKVAQEILDLTGERPHLVDL